VFETGLPLRPGKLDVWLGFNAITHCARGMAGAGRNAAVSSVAALIAETEIFQQSGDIEEF